MYNVLCDYYIKVLKMKVVHLKTVNQRYQFFCVWSNVEIISKCLSDCVRRLLSAVFWVGCFTANRQRCLVSSFNTTRPQRCQTNSWIVHASMDLSRTPHLTIRWPLDHPAAGVGLHPPFDFYISRRLTFWRLIYLIGLFWFISLT